MINTTYIIRGSKKVSLLALLSVMVVAMLLGLFLQSRVSAATPGFKQSKAVEISSGTKANVALTSANSAGNLMVVEVLWSNTNAVTLSDSRGNSYVAATTRTTWNSSFSGQIFYAKNIAAGTNTVTATFATSLNSFAIVQAHEYSGVDKVNPLDAAVSASGTNKALNSGNLTTTAAGDLLFAAGGDIGSMGTPSGGWTSRLNTSGNISADKLAGAAGSYNATSTGTGGKWVMQLVAFKADNGVDIAAPSAPATLAATAASSSQVNLSWAAASDNVGVTGYQVERCQGAGCTNFSLQTTTAGNVTTLADIGLAPSTTYLYRVRATDAAGNLGAYSPVAQATTQGAPDTAAPSVPASLTGMGASISQINLSWTASTDNTAVTGYKVFRNNVQVGTTATNSYQDSGLAVNTSYSYKVSAYDAAGNNSGQSTAVIVNTLADTTAPSIPSSVVYQIVSTTQINISWNASSDNVGVAGYKVYRNGTAATTVTSTSFQDSGLTAGTAYSYCLTAMDAAGNESARTATVQVTTLNPDTTAPDVALSAPASGSTLSGTVTISATATDNSGIHDVQFYLDGNALSNDSSAPYTYQWNTTLAANGTHQLTAVATDTSGNASAQVVVTVTVNNTAGGTVPNPLKIMPLGDSMTQGGVNGGFAGLYLPTANGYRLDLKNLLTGYTIDYVGPYQVGNSSLADQDEAGESGACIKTTGCGGNTMYPLTAGWLNTYNPDLVIMQGGGNDYTNHSNTTAIIEGYMESWIQLILQTKPNIKIIVCGNAQWNDDLEALTKAYVEGLQAQGKAIRFCPLAATAAAQTNTIDSTHPNANGYLVWAQELAPKIRELFPQ